jgi:cardiolipin synthase
MDPMPQAPAPRSVKRRILRILAVLAVIQGVTAWLVTVRAKRAVAARDAIRPETYPSRTFEEVLTEPSDELVKLYMRGDELIADMVAAIDAAKQFVYVETFIWIDDECGRVLRDALGRAVGRGVRVNVIYDWVLSSRNLGDGYFADGIDVLTFRPITGRDALRLSNVLRDHRKLLITDGTTGFIGGYNFGDEYVAWRDTHIRITGESVRELENAFVDFWNQHRGMLVLGLPHAEERSWDPFIVVHRNDPSMGIFPIRGMYLEAIDRAKDRIWITNAYFVPDRSFRTALEDASRRGVDVRVMVPGRSNHSLADALAHGMFEDLLAAGVRVYLYRDFMVHAKTATIDGSWSTVGTANLDRWSMLGNYEINAEVRSEPVARQLEALFLHDIDNCFEMKLDAWRRRPVHARAAEKTLRALSPLM